MKRITAIAWKDTLLRFSSWSQLLFFLILPIVFTFILGGSGISEEASKIPVLIVNQDGGEIARQISQALNESEALAASELSLAEAEEAFADEEAPIMVIIPAGFESALMQGGAAAVELRKAPNDSDAETAERAVAALVSTVGRLLTVAHNSVSAAEQRQPFASEAARQAYLAQSLAAAQTALAATPDRVKLTQPADATQSDGSFDLAAHQSAGQLITWVLIPLLGTSVLLAFERTSGTLRRLITTPTDKATYLLGTIAGQYAAGLVQMALLVGFGILVMKVNWGNSPPALILMLVTFGLAAVAFGTMLGTFVRTDSQAQNISIMAGMSMALLGGCWFPMELFPETARNVVRVLPTTWAMQGLTDIVMRGKGPAEVVLEAAVLLGFATVFFIVGVWRFRYE
jgi:ABC-2 type transport system permease protein